MYIVGGIGVFIAKTGLEVTSNTSFSFTAHGWVAFLEKFHLLAVVFSLEAGLRVLSRLTKSKYPLLSPIYFCSIPPFFYVCAGIWHLVSGKTLGDEYYFPPLTTNNVDDNVSELWGDDVWEIFRIFNIGNVSWVAVTRSIPTMIALVLFSLIHVPINIPAFAVSSGVDVDMNAELVAHGYSNGIAGLVGGTIWKAIGLFRISPYFNI